MSVIDRVTERDEPAEVPAVDNGGDDRLGGAESVETKATASTGPDEVDARSGHPVPGKPGPLSQQ